MSDREDDKSQACCECTQEFIEKCIDDRLDDFECDHECPECEFDESEFDSVKRQVEENTEHIGELEERLEALEFNHSDLKKRLKTFMQEVTTRLDRMEREGAERERRLLAYHEDLTKLLEDPLVDAPPQKRHRS